MFLRFFDVNNFLVWETKYTIIVSLGATCEYISSSNRKARRPDEEVGLLFYPQAIRQSLDPGKSAFRDIGRSFAIKEMMSEAKFDALDQYRTSSLFTDAERATLDYVTELTKEKKVDPETFARMARYYSELEICEIVWFVASEHLYNITNIGLNIHSDMLCDVSKKRKAA